MPFKSYFKQYFNSFKLDRRFFNVFLTDVGFWAIAALLFRLMAFVLNNRAAAISNGRTSEQLKEFVFSAPPDQLQALASQMRGYVFIFIFSVLAFAVVSWLLFSLSRYLIWSIVLKKKFEKKKHWRWNLLNLVLVFFFFLFLTAYAIVMLPLASAGLTYGVQAVMMIFALLFLYFIFSMYMAFADEGKVWSGIGKGFGLIKKNFKKMAVSYVFSFVTLLVVALVLNGLGLMLQASFVTYLNLVVILLLMAWLRFYLAGAVGEVRE